MNLNLKEITRFIGVLIIVSIASFIYWVLYNKPMDGIDDANIYFVYIRNVAEGHGFVYNPGSEHVEGFTSLLWVLILVPFYFLNHDYEHYILFANVILIAILFYYCLKMIQRIASQKNFFSIPAIVFLIFVIAIPGYIDWNILSLMETSLWGFLLVTTTMLLCREMGSRQKLFFSICIGLLVLTRPESILWAVVFIFLLFVKRALESQSFKKAFGAIIMPVITFLVVIAGLAMFRIKYFGYPLPNTYYAKVSSDLVYNIKSGLFYIMLCVIQSPYLVLVILSVLFSLIYLLIKAIKQYKATKTITADDAEKTQFIISAMTIVSFLIPVYVGGDHFELLRGIQPFVPIYLLGLLNLNFWRKLVNVNLNVPTTRPANIVLALCFIPVIFFMSKTPLLTFRHGGSPLINEFKLGDEGRREGEKMNELFAPMGTLPSVGVSAAGGFKFGYNGVVIDLMGLNNVRMAHANKIKTGLKNHAAFDKKIFYEQSPEVFHSYAQISYFVESLADSSLLENDPKFKDHYFFRVYKGIFAETRFVNEYSPVIIYDDSKKIYLKTHARNDYIEKLLVKGIKVKRIGRLL